MAERDDYATQLADYLEELATKVRSLTVDRVADGVTWAALGVVLAVVGIVVAVWASVAFFRALGTLVGMEAAYALVGGIFVVAGSLVWIRRFPDDEE
ncbi:MAG TPA: hypothetical protein ENK55_01395 [Actinobacteria bacterium]|nr:hypothetical protein [Actinomycetota bacterium]